METFTQEICKKNRSILGDLNGALGKLQIWELQFWDWEDLPPHVRKKIPINPVIFYKLQDDLGIFPISLMNTSEKRIL